MERFLDLTFLAVRPDEAKVNESWCPDEVVKQELVGLGWPEEAIWTRDGSQVTTKPSILRESKMSSMCIYIFRCRNIPYLVYYSGGRCFRF